MIMYLLFVHFISCIYMSLVGYNPQQNWFRRVLEGEFQLALDDVTSPQHVLAVTLNDFEVFYEHVINNVNLRM